MKYGDMQAQLNDAFRRYREQQHRASQIMQNLAEACVLDLAIPRQNLTFRKLSGGTARFPVASMAIERNDEGVWESELIVRVDATEQAGTYIEKYLHLNVEFRPNGAALLSLEEQDDALELAVDAKQSAIREYLPRVVAALAEMFEWVEKGKGSKPSIGFNFPKEQ